MRFKSFVVRSRPHRPSRISLDPNPSPASLPGEANERFASGVNTPHCDSGDAEIVPETFDERDVPPPKKRHCLGTSETTRGEGGGLNLEACIVCNISDEGVSRCSGTGCLLWFHWECLDPELSTSEDLAKSYCPYCWYKVLVMRHRSVREKAVEAEKEVVKYLSEETRRKDGSVDRTDREGRGEKDDVCSSEKEDSDRHQEDTEKFQDAEEDEDDEEATKDQTIGNRDARGEGGVARCLSMQESSLGKEQDQIQESERPRGRRRRQLVLNDTDSDISSDESTNERNGEGVTEQMAQVVTTPSGTMRNQQRKHNAATEVAKSKTARDSSSFKTDQRKRLYWTPEEEEMLKVGVVKFSAEAKRNMPWRKILEMGAEVFHETRTPADLKDKWRNRTGTRGKHTN